MEKMTQAQSIVHAKFQNRDPKIQVRWDKRRNSPAEMKGRLAEPFEGTIQKNAFQAAVEFLDENKVYFRMAEPIKDLSCIRCNTDAKGNTCVALQQHYKNVPVHGGTVRVQFSAGKEVNRVASKFEPDIDLDVTPKLTAEKAVEKALADVTNGKKVKAFVPKLIIRSKDNIFRLAWQLEVIDGETGRPVVYFVDADNGDILKKESRFFTMGRGTGVYSGTGDLNSRLSGEIYQLVDNTRTASGGPRIITCDMNDADYDEETPDDTNISEDTDDNWDNTTTAPRHDNQGAEVDIHRHLGQVVDFYNLTFGWNGIDGRGADIYAGAHVRFPGFGNQNNAAYWGTTGCFYFGDGDGIDRDYVTPRDIVAHEFTHGVTDNTSTLDNENEAGGLNEAFSDIFAALFENDTAIGEDYVTPGTAGDCLRELNNPSSPNAIRQIPNHVVAALDSMGTGYFNGQEPHQACGPVLYVAGLLLVGGTHPNSNISVVAIGYTKMAQIFWHIQSIGLLGNNNATFLECREAALNAVESLYKTEPDYLRILDSVKNAFTAVGIGPDIYVRDNPRDEGQIPNSGPLCRSPDIIVRQSREEDPATILGDLDDDSLGEDVEAGQDNYVYVRLLNRGAAEGDVMVKLYWVEPGTFARPADWHLIDSVPVADVQPGGLSFAEFHWRKENLPPVGSFCLVAELDDPLDPAPDKSLIMTGGDFSRFIAESNNFAWKNINVRDILPDGLADCEFVLSGDNEGASGLQFDLTPLPSSTEVYLKILSRLTSGAELSGLTYQRSNTRYSYFNMKAGQVCTIRKIQFQTRDLSEVHLYVKVPEASGKTYRITLTQLVDDGVTGRLTNVLNVLGAEDFEFIGNRNTKEVHKRHCQWVTKMSGENKVGFRSLNNAKLAGYDNCYYCLGDSKW